MIAHGTNKGWERHVNHSTITNLFLITGTTRGLGRALVEQALQEPGTFVISLSRIASSIQGNHQTIQIDLNRTHEIGPAFKCIRIDRQHTIALTRTVLINNAGVLDPIEPLVDCDDGQLAQNIQTNLTAPMVLSRHFFHFSHPLPGRKWIINLTSGASQSPYHGWSAYCASKAGIDMATRVLAMELSRIDPSFAACAIAPGTVDTRMQEKIRRCSREQFEQVDKFIQLKEYGALAPPAHAASKILRLLMKGNLKNGQRYDLRNVDEK
jgi:benzil reductase ((S)-benzoin forming)